MTTLMETVRRMFAEPGVRAAFLRHPEEVLTGSGLSKEEKRALRVSRPALVAMGPGGHVSAKGGEVGPAVPWY